MTEVSLLKKISDVAKDSGVSITVIINFFSKHGIKKNPNSKLTEEEVSLIFENFKREHEHKELREKKRHISEELIEKPKEIQSQQLVKKRKTKTETEVSFIPIERESIKIETVSEKNIDELQKVETEAENKTIDVTTETNYQVETKAEEIIIETSSIIEEEKIDKQEEFLTGVERQRKELEKTKPKVLRKIELEKKEEKKEKVVIEEKKSTEIPVKKKKKVKKKKEVKKEETPVKKAKYQKFKKIEINEGDIKRAIEETLSSNQKNDAEKEETHRKIKKRKEQKRIEEEQKETERIEKEKVTLKITEYISISELANLMGVNAASLIQKSFEIGKMVSINQRIEKDFIELLALEFGFTIEFQNEFTSNELEDIVDAEGSLLPRPPIVTIMGHVDHGKTSLLDYIRSTNVVAGEAGGITQHIGAYEVSLPSERKITFLDTPGHEAFTAMRARGAQLTDVVVLVVAADDSVMPQTLEAISHAQAANVPIIIAINKIDKVGANSEKIRQQLSQKNVLVEEYGGKYQCVEISAKTGLSVELLLEKILIETDVIELKSNPNRNARGAVVESQLEKGRGIVATVLVQKGTLKIGDPFVCGNVSGKIRAMFDERGKKVLSAPPSTPVLCTGFDEIPQAGDEFIVVDSEKTAREISSQRSQLQREQDFRRRGVTTLDEISEQIKDGKIKNLNLIIKGDVDGSVEAIADSLQKLSTNEVRVYVVHRGVGAITESDVLLAATSNAVIIGFNIRPSLSARNLAHKENVEIRVYNIIYKAIEEIKKTLEGLLAPEVKEEIVCTIIVRETFKIPKIGLIAGAYVEDGSITRNTKVRLIRDGIEVFDGNISSLKRFKDDVKEVQSGMECGISLDGYNDVKVNDVVEGYKIVEIKRKL